MTVFVTVNIEEKIFKCSSACSLSDQITEKFK